MVFRVVEPIASAAAARAQSRCAPRSIKFDRFEWMVEKATELGVDRILPVEATRSEKGLFEASRKRSERWAADRARKQPAIAARARAGDPAGGAIRQRRLAPTRGTATFWTRAAAPPLLREIPAERSDSVALLLGPEGGWTDAERAGGAPCADGRRFRWDPWCCVRKPPPAPPWPSSWTAWLARETITGAVANYSLDITLIVIFALVQWRITRMVLGRTSNAAMCATACYVFNVGIVRLLFAHVSQSCWPSIPLSTHLVSVLGAGALAYLMTATAMLAIYHGDATAARVLHADDDPGRRRVLNVAGNALMAAPFAAMGYGAFVERTDFRVREVDVPLPGLPARPGRPAHSAAQRHPPERLPERAANSPA